MKWRIWIVVLLTNMVLLSLEIAGSRILAPAYGDTIFVWGVLIGVILTALSLGYWLGGIFADRWPTEWMVGLILAVAGILVLLIPFVNDVATPLEGSSVIGPLVATLLLFFLPATLCAMVAPYALKLRNPGRDHLGAASGTLSAIATTGNVLGTVLTAFILVWFVPLETIILLFAATLLLCAAILEKRFAALLLLPLIAFLFFGLGRIPSAVMSPFSMTVNVTLPSQYGDIKVYDEGCVRTLEINQGKMMQVNRTDPDRTVEGWEYVDCFQLPFNNTEGEEVLALGLGAGQYQRLIRERYGAQVETVEINPVVKEAATRYFGIEESEGFAIHIADARAYLHTTKKRYDVIAMDVFRFDPGAGYKIPAHLATFEFFQLVKSHLEPDGIFIINVVPYDGSPFLMSEYATIHAVFNETVILDCNTRVMLASDSRERIELIRPGGPVQKVYDAEELKEEYPFPASKIITDDQLNINPFAELADQTG